MALGPVAHELADLFGVMALGEGGSLFVAPRRHEGGPIEATVREWFADRA